MATRSLRGEVAIVTGASSGIGAATARELAARGATVVLAARRAGALEAEVERIRARGGAALAIPTDLTDEGKVAQLAHRATAACGRIDILVNNAGIGMPGPLARLELDQIRAQLATNLGGAVLLTRALLPGMIARRHGTIVSVASLASYVPSDPLYSATKFGLRGFSLALDRQLQGTGVRATMVSPGFIRTAMNPDIQRNIPGPELVAREIATLILRPRRQVVLPRHYYLDIWAERIMPWLMTRVLRRHVNEHGPIRHATRDLAIGRPTWRRLFTPG